MSLEAFPVVVMKQSFTGNCQPSHPDTDASPDEERVLQCEENQIRFVKFCQRDVCFRIQTLTLSF